MKLDVKRQCIGVIQGRLSPRPAERLQAFPWLSWENEFTLAAALGFDGVEWIWEDGLPFENPIWSVEGRRRIRDVGASTGVACQSVCADYFMKHRLSERDDAARARAVRLLGELIDYTAEVGGRRILLPLLEEAGLPDAEAVTLAQASLAAVAERAEAAGVVLGLEMEIAGPAYAELIRGVGSRAVRAYYDTGNSTAAGFDIAVDIIPLLPLLEAVHVKDRRVGGTSQPLGFGDARFDAFFDLLGDAGFRGDFVLQHYFATDPARDALRSLNYVRGQLARSRRVAA